MSLRVLLYSSLGYLLTPILLFLYFWIHPQVSILALAALFFTCWRLIPLKIEEARIPLKPMGILLALASFWGWLSGAGEFVVQIGDWEKHNQIFFDLIKQEWPVQYANRPASYLCYYLAYYLVPAFITKLIGIESVLIVVYVWTTLGIWLAFSWIYVLSRNRIVVVIGFILSGDILWLTKLYTLLTSVSLANLTWQQRPPIPFYFLTYFTGKHTIMLSYDAATPMLVWIPQHVLGIWIAMGIGWAVLQNKINRQWLGLTFLSLPLWTTVGSLGFVPWMVYIWVKTGTAVPNRAEWFSWLGSIPALVTIALYFTGHQPLDTAGWFLPDFWRAAIFFFLSWGVYVCVGYWLEAQDRFFSIVSGEAFIWVGVCLIGSSFVYIGLLNDFGNRFAMASRWVLWMGCWANAVQWLAKRKSLTYFLPTMGLLLVLSTQNSIRCVWQTPSGLYQQLAGGKTSFSLREKLLEQQSNPDYYMIDEMQPILAKQYLGTTVKGTANWIMRTNNPEKEKKE